MVMELCDRRGDRMRLIDIEKLRGCAMVVHHGAGCTVMKIIHHGNTQNWQMEVIKLELSEHSKS